MKPFFSIFVPLFLFLIATAIWALLSSFPMPGNERIPAAAGESGANASRVFDVILLPGKWSGDAAMFVGSALWAFLPSLAFAVVWRFAKRQTMSSDVKRF